MDKLGTQIRPMVSVVVPCRNEKRQMLPFFESLVAQEREGMDVEVIIADGRSTDGTRELLRDYEERFEWVRVVENSGRIVSTGLNLAIGQARGRIIVRMDVHSEYAPDYVRRCVEVLVKTGADNVGGAARARAEGFVARCIAAAYRSPFGCGGARFHDETYEGFVDTVTYGCWWKSTLERLGLFDERLIRNQDDELNLRIVRSGGKIWQSASIVSWYKPRTRLRDLFLQYFQYGYWKVVVIAKHRAPASWRHLIPVTFVSANIVLFCALVFASTAGLRGMVGLAGGTLAAVCGSYGIASLGASFMSARRDGWRLLLLLPFVFAVYHLAYGIGMLAGILQWPGQRLGWFRPSPLLTRISR